MSALGAGIVDWTALGKVVIASLVAGVGVSLCFALAVFGVIRFGEMRRDSRGLEAAWFGALGFAGLAVTTAAIVVAIVVMTKKS